MAKKKKNDNKIKAGARVLIKNRRATFDYEILDTYTAGIMLLGTEIKSIRLGKASLVDTFCIIDHGEVWVKNLYIAEYFFGSYNNHNERRDRKLLLNKKEIRALEQDTKDSGFTIIPLKLFINGKGLAKLEIGLARGKKQYDKRESIKERDTKRELAQVLKHRY
ncbi:SsrA-binding protein [Porphyromonadaceae bacterium W3.11]|nr:SsrA-binding protein [Porphyromonadaceae bacterium W3.11]